MNHNKLVADHCVAMATRKELLNTERLVSPKKIGPAWISFRRKGIRVRTKLLKYLYKHTSGKFAVGAKYISFENEHDALMYKIAFPK